MKNDSVRWFIKISIITFIISVIMSYISTNALSDLDVIPAILILILVVIMGVIFDVIGVSITVAKEKEFHAKATKKVQGAKTSIFLIKNSAKVANICADVIGDVCGVLSGTISALVTVKIVSSYGLDPNVQIAMSAMVASLTVGGKSLGKSLAQSKSTDIVFFAGRVMSFFVSENKKIEIIKRRK